MQYTILGYYFKSFFSKGMCWWIQQD